jgi:hypothetical protein
MVLDAIPDPPFAPLIAEHKGKQPSQSQDRKATDTPSRKKPRK